MTGGCPGWEHPPISASTWDPRSSRLGTGLIPAQSRARGVRFLQREAEGVSRKCC